MQKDQPSSKSRKRLEALQYDLCEKSQARKRAINKVDICESDLKYPCLRQVEMEVG